MAGSSKGKNTVSVVYDMALPIAESLGLKLWDVRFLKEGVMWVLRIVIDKDGGVNIDDCENMSKALDPVLDEADVIEQSYHLEVSSPGIERELMKPEHFAEFTGAKIFTRLIRPVDGTRDFRGTLDRFEDNIVSMTLESGEKFSFEKKQAAYVKLDDFDD